MLALSPLLPAFGLPLEEDQINFESLVNFNQQEWNSLDSFGCSSSPFENEVQHNPKNSSGTNSDSRPSAKKLCHNASERDRRRKLNDLYSSLGSLLPNTDQNKKLSIPATISHALKYIPQLQNQVERLIERKEEILLSMSKRSDDHLWKQKKTLREQSLPTVSTSQIGDREVVIQICTSSNMRKCPFSQVLQNLEEEQLQIHNASTFASCENNVFYTLHVQVKETQRVQCELLSGKIISLC